MGRPHDWGPRAPARKPQDDSTPARRQIVPNPTRILRQSTASGRRPPNRVFRDSFFEAAGFEDLPIGLAGGACRTLQSVLESGDYP
jgi:hypothetical protein